MPNDDDDTEWEMITRTGSNGLVLVVMALSWWVVTENETEPSMGLLTTIDDVQWVLARIVKANAGPNSDATSISKQSRESGSEEPDPSPDSKKFIHLVLP